MGPLQTMLKVPGGMPPNPQANGLGYNPRCLSRDINLQAANSTSDFEVSSLIQIKDIARFQTVYQGEFAKNFMGVHTVGLPSNTCRAWILNLYTGRTLHYRRRCRLRLLQLTRRSSILSSSRHDR